MDLIAGRTSLHESEVVQGCAAELVLGMFTNCAVANLPILLSELQVEPNSHCSCSEVCMDVVHAFDFERDSVSLIPAVMCSAV